MTALAIMRLLPEGFVVTGGSIVLEGDEILALPPKRMRAALRGNRMSMIFQEPMSSLNPLLTIGDQIGEVLRWHQDLGAAEVRDRTKSRCFAPAAA